MAYLSKETLLAAYKVLATLSENPSAQGATQKVSAIRYALALDMFYNEYHRECDTRNSQDKASFVEKVGIVVALENGFYTTNFYVPVAEHQGDFSVGSNFYSVGAVKNSLMNPAVRISYPQRGSSPLFEIQDGKLYWKKELLKNFSFYVPSAEFKCALALWLCRARQVRLEDIYGTLKSQIEILFTSELTEILMPSIEIFETTLKKLNVTANFNPAYISKDDIESIFKQNQNKNLPRQIIYFGAPGTGKSFRVEQITEQYGDDVIRTTFHPDSDYSTFVGCYKPSMESIPQTYTVEGKEKPIIGKDGEQVTKKEIVYSFVPQAFTQAYTRAWLNPDKPIFLVIEELNRGNCAQIFGDIFQLLDRNENNESAYSIIPDHDLQQYLATEFKNAENIPSDIKEAKAMRLPANLYIWATMNTSDQSLFPIDSAFKRRWIWKYIPIADAGKDYKIQVGNHQYDWWTFVEKVNGEIEGATKSEDKKLGYFFAKADNNIIAADTFVSKVVFYLWNDVFKDSYDKTIFKNDLTFHKFFLPNGDPKIEVIDQFMHDLDLKADGEE